VSTLHFHPRVNFGAALEPIGKIYHGAGQSDDAFRQYSALFGAEQRPVIYMSYVGVCGARESITAKMKLLGAEWMEFPTCIPQLGISFTGGRDTGEGRATEVARGDYDDNLIALAAGLRELGRPTLARIGYEFEGSWNGYQREAFAEAFRRIVRIFREHNVPFASVWCSAGGTPAWLTLSELMDYYPGDDWVDWWGVDLFSPEELVAAGLEDFLDASNRHKKPVLIGEMSPRYVGTLDAEVAWRRWFLPLLKLIARRPEIKGTAYINWDWPDWSDRLKFGWHDWGDCRIESSPELAKRWVSALSDPIFLHAGRH